MGGRQGEDRSPAATLDGKTGGFLVKVERLAGPVQVRLFHTSVTRAIATWPTWPGERASPAASRTSSPSASRHRSRPTSPCSSPGSSARTPTSSRACTGKRPTGRSSSTSSMAYKPDLALVGFSETDEFQHQFLGLVTKRLPNGAKNPAYDDIEVNGTPDGRVEERSAYIREAYAGRGRDDEAGPGAHARPRPDHVRGSDHGFAPQFAADRRQQAPRGPRPAVQAADGNCRPAAGETIGKAKACWAGGTAQIYLNVAGRDPAVPGPPAGPGDRRGDDGRQDPPPSTAPGPERLDRRREARALEGDRPDVHEGRGPLRPERPAQHRRHVASDPHR